MIEWYNYFEGTHTGFNSSQLESKVYNGEPVLHGAILYVASLQANEKHICTAGIIYWDLLITSASCICEAIEYMNSRAIVSAVIGHIDLNEGERYYVQGVIYHSSYICRDKYSFEINENYRYDIGVVLVGRIIKILTIKKNSRNGREDKDGRK